MVKVDLITDTAGSSFINVSPAEVRLVEEWFLLPPLHLISRHMAGTLYDTPSRCSFHHDDNATLFCDSDQGTVKLSEPVPTWTFEIISGGQVNQYLPKQDVSLNTT